MKEQEKRLRDWIEKLDKEKIIDIAIECIQELILTESVNFYENTKVPYWDVTGDRLDGSEPIYEEED